MSNWDKHRNTRFIQKSDVGPGILVTISKVTEEDFQNNGRDETKFVVHFREDYKPWIPNLGSLEEIASIKGSGTVEDWSGTVIVLYVNPDVEMGGKKTGGIRCRAPKNQPPVNEQPPATQPSGENPDWVGDDPAPPTDEIAF